MNRFLIICFCIFLSLFIIPVNSSTQETTSMDSNCIYDHPNYTNYKNVFEAKVTRGQEKGEVHVIYELNKSPIERDTPFSFYLQNKAIFKSANGFKNGSNSKFIWIGDTFTPSIIYSFKTYGPPRKTSTSYIEDFSDYSIGSNWMLAPLPVDHNQPYIEIYTANEGIAGENVVYIGNTSVSTVSTGCHEITVVKPNASSPVLSNKDITSILLRTDQALGFGKENYNVTVFLSPDNMTRGGFAFNSDAVVQSNLSKLYLIETLIHEYIHTRQPLDYGKNIEWLKEASPEYYSYRFMYEFGYISESNYKKMISNGKRVAGILSKNSTWTGNLEYYRGKRLLYALDSRLKKHNSSIDEVMSAFYESDNLTYSKFEEIVERKGGKDLKRFLYNHTFKDKTVYPIDNSFIDILSELLGDIKNYIDSIYDYL